MRQPSEREFISFQSIKVVRHADGRFMASCPDSGVDPCWGQSERDAINRLKAKLDTGLRTGKVKGV